MLPGTIIIIYWDNLGGLFPSDTRPQKVLLERSQKAAGTELQPGDKHSLLEGANLWITLIYF